MRHILVTLLLLPLLIAVAACSDDATNSPDGDIDGDQSTVTDGDSDISDGDTPDITDGDSPDITDGDATEEIPIDPDNACLTIDDDSTPVMDLSAEPTRLFGIDSTAMNTMDQTKSPLTMRMHAPLTANRCGSAGLVYLEPENDDLRYLDLSTPVLAKLWMQRRPSKTKSLPCCSTKPAPP